MKNPLNLQKVWVVTFDYGCCDSDLFEIFSSEEKAKRFLEHEGEDNGYFDIDDYTIKEYYINGAEIAE